MYGEAHSIKPPELPAEKIDGEINKELKYLHGYVSDLYEISETFKHRLEKVCSAAKEDSGDKLKEVYERTTSLGTYIGTIANSAKAARENLLQILDSLEI